MDRYTSHRAIARCGVIPEFFSQQFLLYRVITSTHYWHGLLSACQLVFTSDKFVQVLDLLQFCTLTLHVYHVYWVLRTFIFNSIQAKVAISRPDKSIVLPCPTQSIWVLFTGNLWLNLISGWGNSFWIHRNWKLPITLKLNAWLEPLKSISFKFRIPKFPLKLIKYLPENVLLSVPNRIFNVIRLVPNSFSRRSHTIAFN